jgi:phosphoribosylglycinamide formyltransferase-1
MPIKKLIVLFSGNGSNLENLILQLHKKRCSSFMIEIVAAICNNADAKGIKKAEKHGIKTILVEHKEFKVREEFDAKLVEIINSFDVDLTILAGFMRILTPVFTKNVRAINIHPSILPLFKGANAIEDSFNSSMKVAGVSVHFVVEALDSGEIVAQKCFSKDGLDFEAFEKKIHEVEYELFPNAILTIL